ncbi:hypothetical protein FBQ97_01610 [Acidobacteria bacterium ACD]|nr:MAG: hypothetical protein EDX89_20850 [Acidobacteriota bacterium]MCE7956850.1 hypothetical protein [Acidobacteria bacterium ACB2]MDL1948498.1 hypothetical protein [Acidobacteria bacterium ACD]
MPFDVKKVMRELEAEPLLSPYPDELARAVVYDVFRHAGQRPPSGSHWDGLSTGAGLPRMAEQAGMLAHALASTSLGKETRRALTGDRSPEEVLDRFFRSIEPLTAELVRNNALRQEEFVRKWIAAVSGTVGSVAGETPEESRRRLEGLDYGNTLAEYKKAEKAREQEAKRRAEALRKAAEAAAAQMGRE